MVQVPTATSVTVLPLTAHTGAVSDANVTGNPDDAVALTVNGAAPRTRSTKAANTMVCGVSDVTLKL